MGFQVFSRTCATNVVLQDLKWLSNWRLSRSKCFLHRPWLWNAISTPKMPFLSLKASSQRTDFIRVGSQCFTDQNSVLTRTSAIKATALLNNNPNTFQRRCDGSGNIRTARVVFGMLSCSKAVHRGGINDKITTAHCHPSLQKSTFLRYPRREKQQ